MPTIPRKIRLACELKDSARLIDEYTGETPVLYLNEDVVFEIALFQNDGIILHSDLDMVDFYISGTAPISQSVTAFNETLTAKQWRSGAAALFSISIDAATVAGLEEGSGLIYVTATNPSGAVGQYLYATIQRVERDPVVAVVTPLPAASYYTKTQSDARYTLAADFAVVPGQISDLETAANVRYDAQTLDAGQKAQALSNIGAAPAGSSVEGIASSALAFGSYQAWNATLTADLTLTATGSPSVGLLYTVNLIQDATGGRNVTWPSGYVVASSAALNPKPSQTTAFGIRSKRIAGGSTSVSVEPLLRCLPESEPAYRFDLRQRNRLTFTSSNLSTATDPFSGMVTTGVGTLPAFVADGIRSRPAASPAGSSYSTFAASGTTAPFDTAIPAGFTVACVFDSRAATDARLVHLGPLGMSIDQRGGNIEFGSQSTSANRVAVPFTPNDSAATLAIFTYHAGGGASALLIKHGAAIKVAYASGAVAGTTTTEWQLFQAQGGTARWTGRVGHVALYDRALTWEQTQSLAAKLCAEFSIN